jgi:hypothetical protein
MLFSCESREKSAARRREGYGIGVDVHRVVDRA